MHDGQPAEGRFSLRAGIVGPRGIGTNHARALARLGVPVTGLVASSPSSARKHAERLGDGVAYASVSEMVASGNVEVVHVCTPNRYHAEAAEEVLAGGCHLICEKPLTTDLASAASLVESAGRSSLETGVCQTFRYCEGSRELRRLVSDGALGEVQLVTGTMLSQELLGLPDEHWLKNYSETGPTLSVADLGVHWFDLVEHVTGHTATALLAQPSRTAPDQPFRYGTVITLELANGAMATVAISQECPGLEDEMTLNVFGSAGTARWSLTSGGDELVVTASNGPAARRHFSTSWSEGFDDAFTLLISAIYEQIRGGESGAPDVMVGYRGVAFLDAVARSAREWGWVSVPPRRLGPALGRAE